MVNIRKRYMKIRRLQLAIAVAMALTSVATVQANLITGSLWENTSGYGDPSQIPNRAPDVTFSVNSPLNFDSQVGVNGYTIGGWLGNGGATILTGASEANNSMDWVMVQFLGQVSVVNGQNFTVAHDDGLTLIIGGVTVISQSGPTAPVVTTATYTGPSGNEPFELVYGEGWGPPAVLNVDLPFSSVPEPITMLDNAALLLLPLGFQGVRMLRNRRQTA
jgi:hypothetical protein